MPLADRPSLLFAMRLHSVPYYACLQVVDYPVDEVFVVDANQPSGQQWLRLKVAGEVRHPSMDRMHVYVYVT